MHEGKPIIRNSPDKKTVVVLCPVGHLYATLPMQEWANSWLEAKATDAGWTVKCQGTIAQAEQAELADANREMGLPEDGEYGDQ